MVALSLLTKEIYRIRRQLKKKAVNILPGELGSDDAVEATMAAVTAMETARIRKDNPEASVCRNILVLTMVPRPLLRVGLHLAHAVRCARSLCSLSASGRTLCSSHAPTL